MEKCGKTLFPSGKIARAEINKIKRTSHRSKIPKREYFCKKCNAFHITSRKTK